MSLICPHWWQELTDSTWRLDAHKWICRYCGAVR